MSNDKNTTILNLSFIQVALFFVCVLFALPQSAQANQGLVQSMVEQADFIFEGVVTSVEHVMSKADEAHPDQVPFNFVTYDIVKIIKGNYSSSIVTMRFVGGPIGDKDKYMSIPGFPLFDPGDHDILMVQGNVIRNCPLVGCSQGRFRIIDGVITNEFGLLMNPDSLGEYIGNKAIANEAIDTHEMNQVTMSLVKTAEDGDNLYDTSDIPMLLDEGIAAPSDSFSEHVNKAVETAYSESEQNDFDEFISADVNVDLYYDSGKIESREPVDHSANLPVENLALARRERRREVLPPVSTGIVEERTLSTQVKSAEVSTKSRAPIYGALVVLILLISYRFLSTKK